MGERAVVRLEWEKNPAKHFKFAIHWVVKRKKNDSVYFVGIN
jgi:hypothetical protein